LPGSMSVIAFHEKAGRSQGGFVVCVSHHFYPQPGGH
jgi:hypothetical protein